MIRPKTIAVTSNYHPKDLWPSDQELNPIKRRFYIIKMAAPYRPEGSKGYNERVRANALYPGHLVQAAPEQEQMEEEEYRSDSQEWTV
jgi:hypothetical protein